MRKLYAMRVQKGVSMHKQVGKPNWFCSFRVFSKERGNWRWVFRSTKTANEAKAREIARAWHKAALKAGRGELSEDAARQIIAHGVADVFLHGNSEKLGRSSMCFWGKRWLSAKRVETSEATFLR